MQKCSFPCASKGRFGRALPASGEGAAKVAHSRRARGEGSVATLAVDAAAAGCGSSIQRVRFLAGSSAADACAAAATVPAPAFDGRRAQLQHPSQPRQPEPGRGAPGRRTLATAFQARLAAPLQPQVSRPVRRTSDGQAAPSLPLSTFQVQYAMGAFGTQLCAL